MVRQQPADEPARRQALLALQACPVAAIETSRALQRTTPVHGFPSWVCSHAAGEVYYFGWASRRSFGASSWLIQRPDGNVMVDVPRWSAPLARRIRAMGGLARIVLTHRDDVAEHQRWADAFGCERWIHRGDADAAPAAEQILDGQKPIRLAAQLQLVPTPGHTAGSMALLLGD